MVYKPNNWFMNDKGGYFFNSSYYLDELIYERSRNVLKSEINNNIINIINNM